MRLVFTQSAEDDLAEASQWYEEQERHLGVVFLERVMDKLAVIEEFPQVAPVMYRGIRRATVAPYRYSFFYLVDEPRNRIVVMAVEHDARDPEYVRGRLDRERGELG